MYLFFNEGAGPVPTSGLSAGLSTPASKVQLRSPRSPHTSHKSPASQAPDWVMLFIAQVLAWPLSLLRDLGQVTSPL